MLLAEYEARAVPVTIYVYGDGQFNINEIRS